MVVLHRRGVVVPQRELVTAVDEEVVGAATVLKVVDHLVAVGAAVGAAEVLKPWTS